jgi:hypothetical protein
LILQSLLFDQLHKKLAALQINVSQLGRQALLEGDDLVLEFVPACPNNASVKASL